MSTLHIALQDGFTNDTVAISLDGREVYRKDGVKTDLRISRADAIDVETAGGNVTVEVRAKSQSGSISLDPNRTPFLAASLDADGRPLFRTSPEPFGYL
jgi:hypothetical protein